MKFLYLIGFLLFLIPTGNKAVAQTGKIFLPDNGAKFENAVSQVADWTAEFLSEKGVNAISADFQSMLGCPSGSRSAFIEHLKTALGPKNLFIKHPQKCDFQLIAFLVDPDSASAELVIRSEIRDRAGAVVAEFNKSRKTLPVVSNKSDVAQLIGFNAAFKPGRDAKGEIFKAFNSRVLWLSSDSTIAYEGDDALFGISVRANNRRMQIMEGAANTDEEGSGFINLPLSQEYTIELFNNASYEVAVDLRIDGLNVFHFCEPGSRKPDGGPRYWIIKPKSTMEVKGWYKTPQRANAFKTSLAQESAIAQTGLPLDEIGQIGATFSASWEEGKTNPPSDEPSMDVTYSRSDIGTAQGRSVQQNSANVKRQIGQSRAYVGVRYRRED
jgi:hypothetical protein